jgi:16S rRNA (guanine(527)-N(7))-methyltransferase RsmG
MTSSYDEMVRAECRSAGIEAGADVERLLSLYCQELERWNQKINLTSLAGKNLVQRLVVDPIWVAARLGIQGVVCDIGSGNGSPGIPISLARPISMMHFIEARARRAAFIRHVLAMLRIEKAVVHKSRLEDLASGLGSVDWVTLQAVAPTKEIMTGLRLLMKQTTRVVWLTSNLGTQMIPMESVVTTPGGVMKAAILVLDLS